MLPGVFGKMEDRLSILISGPPNYIEGKLLGIVSMVDDQENPSSKGNIQAKEVWKAWLEWGVAENIRVIVFDTISSNTGVYRGAVTLLELELNRKIIWAACRHHIPELEIRNVWSMLFGDNYGPDYKHFVDFKDVWSNLNLNGTIKYLVARSPWLKEQKQKVIKFLSNILTHIDSSKELISSRGDYRQMAELTLKILSVDPPRGFRFEKNKAVNSARWGPAVLFPAQMFMLQDQLIYSIDYQQSLHRMVRYNSLIYVPHFLSSTIGVDAPINDLEHYKNLQQFKKIDAEVADTALKKFYLHLWYLTEELVVLSIFSNKIDSDTKSHIAAKLVSSEKPE